MKNYSQGAKKRAKKAMAGMPELAATPKREPNGRASRSGKERDPGVETLKARCRQMGKQITGKNLREMRAPWWGCFAGRVIGNETMGEQDREALWSAICHMRKVVTQHDAAIGLPKRHAMCMKLLEASAQGEKPKDERTDEERVRDADKALMQVEGWLGYTDPAARSEAKRVVLQDEYCADPDGLILALRCISDGLKGKRPTYRGRA